MPVPIRSLQGFERIYLDPGEKKSVCFRLTPRQVALINEFGQRVVEPGLFEISVGGGQPGVTIPGTETPYVLIEQIKLVGSSFVVE